ncbi:ribonuclease HII [Candidatus Aerophobetes bacterium]|nr:ribonuclease HII [Candidatus Aerophobetes bacterium]
MRILGIDEAGRGPVIGPLVICGIVVRDELLLELKRRGVKDSKLLSPQKRQKLKGVIESISKEYQLIYLSPKIIDQYIINYLELKAIVKLIDKFSPDKVFIDAPTRWCANYKRKIKHLLTFKDVQLIVENFADVNYSVVSAASILAKVARDEKIKKLSKKYGPLGSGYPSDEKTIAFLKECIRLKGEFPEIVRKKWKTAKRILEKNG